MNIRLRFCIVTMVIVAVIMSALFGWLLKKEMSISSTRNARGTAELMIDEYLVKGKQLWANVCELADFAATSPAHIHNIRQSLVSRNAAIQEVMGDDYAVNVQQVSYCTAFGLSTIAMNDSSNE